MQEAAKKKILKVSDLNAALRAEIEQAFGEVWVEGEVANLKVAQSGHCYFTLKDETSQIRAVRFRGRWHPYTPREGESVLVRGTLTIYEARGEYQIVVAHIEPLGIGALMAAYEALKERLRQEGLFDPIHKKQIPLFPRRIALVTSPAGAVLHDFLRIVMGRDIPVIVGIVPVPVQGAGAAEYMAQALAAINQGFSQQVDVIVLARGGGSIEDLWAFNEEVLARAIFKSKLPVMTAIGHETDTTIADFVSDLRAPTPSAAAEIIARACENQMERFRQIHEALLKTTREKIEEYRRRMNLLSPRLRTPIKEMIHFRNIMNQYNLRSRAALTSLFKIACGQQALLTQRFIAQHPLARVADMRQQWEALQHRLGQFGEDFVKNNRNQVALALRQLDLVSPLNILGRGYSITQKIPSLKIVRDADDVTLDETLQIRLHQGTLLCAVREKKCDVTKQDKPLTRTLGFL